MLSVGVLTHFRIVNGNQRMLPRFDKKSEVRHQCNVVMTVKMDLTSEHENRNRFKSHIPDLDTATFTLYNFITVINFNNVLHCSRLFMAIVTLTAIH